eukprot:scaffold219172_cov24-Tisochrysis_lutea.AAC.1
MQVPAHRTSHIIRPFLHKGCSVLSGSVLREESLPICKISGWKSGNVAEATDGALGPAHHVQHREVADHHLGRPGKQRLEERLASLIKLVRALHVGLIGRNELEEGRKAFLERLWPGKAHVPKAAGGRLLVLLGDGRDRGQAKGRKWLGRWRHRLTKPLERKKRLGSERAAVQHIASVECVHECRLAAALEHLDPIPLLGKLSGAISVVILELYLPLPAYEAELHLEHRCIEYFACWRDHSHSSSGPKEDPRVGVPNIKPSLHRLAGVSCHVHVEVPAH